MRFNTSASSTSAVDYIGTLTVCRNGPRKTIVRLQMTMDSGIGMLDRFWTFKNFIGIERSSMDAHKLVANHHDCSEWKIIGAF